MGWLGSLWLSEDITQLEDFKKTLPTIPIQYNHRDR